MSAQTRALARKLKKKQNTSTKKTSVKNNVSEDNLSDFMQAEMVKARLGVLYIFSKTEVDGKFASLFVGGLADYASNSLKGLGAMSGLSGLTTASLVTSAVKTPINETVKYFEGEANKGAKSNIAKEVATSIENKFWSFIKALWSKLKGEVAADMKNWGMLLKTLVKGIVGAVCQAAVPLAGVFDVVKGTSQACVAGFQRVMSWLETRSTAMVKGHPTVIVGAVQKAMNRTIGEGLYTAVKGGLQIGGDIATAGGGAIVKALATGIEIIVQAVMRIFDIVTIQAFAAEAKVHWDARKTSGFTKEHEAFARWFKRYAMKVPAIGALAMNCGYCGGPMQYLAMYNDDNSVIGQKDYLAGVAMLHRHKEFAGKYLNDIGLSFKSPDPVVNGALKAAKNFQKKDNIKQNSVGDVVYGVLTG